MFTDRSFMFIVSMKQKTGGFEILKIINYKNLTLINLSKFSFYIKYNNK